MWWITTGEHNILTSINPPVKERRLIIDHKKRRTTQQQYKQTCVLSRTPEKKENYSLTKMTSRFDLLIIIFISTVVLSLKVAPRAFGVNYF